MNWWFAPIVARVIVSEFFSFVPGLFEESAEELCCEFSSLGECQFSHYNVVRALLIAL